MPSDAHVSPGPCTQHRRGRGRREDRGIGEEVGAHHQDTFDLQQNYNGGQVHSAT